MIFPDKEWVVSSVVFAQLTAESLYFTTDYSFLPLKLPLRMGDPDSLLIYGSFGPPEPTTQTAS